MFLTSVSCEQVNCSNFYPVTVQKVTPVNPHYWNHHVVVNTRIARLVSQGYGTIGSVSRRTAANPTEVITWTFLQHLYALIYTLYISVTTEVLDSKFHLTSQINSEISDNTTVSIDFDIEPSHEIYKFWVVMDTVSAPEMSIKTDPVSSPCLTPRNKKGILGPYKS